MRQMRWEKGWGGAGQRWGGEEGGEREEETLDGFLELLQILSHDIDQLSIAASRRRRTRLDENPQKEPTQFLARVCHPAVD